MPSFNGEPELVPYPDGVTWYLLAPLVYVRDDGPIQVPAFFETDFASVPTAVTNIFPRWGTYGRAAIVHDWLYWSQPKTRAAADAIFLEAMGVLKVAAWKRLCLYGAVRWFGQSAWDSNATIGSEGYSRIHTDASPDTPAWHR